MNLFKSLFAFITLLLIGNHVNAQNSRDSLKIDDFKSNIYSFTIKNDILTGDGATFLFNAIKEAQYFILGEYHGSKRISEFTKNIIPTFKKSGYNYFGLEVGPQSAKLLNKLSQAPEKTTENLKSLNSKYNYKSKSRTYHPIPFFTNVSDAEFLQEAAENNLKLIGLDQEFKFSFIPLVNRMYDNLSKKHREKYKEQFKHVTDTLDSYYNLEMDYYINKTDPNQRFTVLFKNSKFLNSFLDEIVKTNPISREIVKSMKTSIEIYWNSNMGFIKKESEYYYKGNQLRTKNFKTNLYKGLSLSNFDFKNNKMLIKIGGLHAAKGMNNYSMYDIGNTLYELAQLNGNTSLHTVFLSRFKLQENEVYDLMENKKSWTYKNFKEFIKLGKKNEWTIIDLRPMKSDVNYSRKYLLSKTIQDYFNRYDLVIIPPMDEDGVLNKNP